MFDFDTTLDHDTPTALLEADAEGQPRWILLVIDWGAKTISAETRDPKEQTSPETRWRGLEDAYPLPPFTDATQLREWVETEVVPLAAPLAEVYQTVWEDVEQYGRFPGHEDEKNEFDASMNQAEPPLHDGGLWPVADWLAGGVEEVSHETTDAALDSLADTILAEAATENVVLVGDEDAAVTYLRDLRQDLRDAIPEPDTHLIRGYEVIEKTVMAFGSSAHVPAPKAWRGKRVKLVRLDP